MRVICGWTNNYLIMCMSDVVVFFVFVDLIVLLCGSICTRDVNVHIYSLDEKNGKQNGLSDIEQRTYVLILSQNKIK